MGSCVNKPGKPQKCSLVNAPIASKVEYLKSTEYLGIHSEYSFTKIIGHGQFGTVRLAVKKSDQTEASFAVKSIPKKNFRTQKSLRREFKIMNRIDHPNIVKLYEAYEDQLYLHLVMEMCAGGNIFERICKHGPYSEEKASVIMKQLLEAVDYLHSNNIAHRDLKPENLLYISDDSDLIKLCDFGTSIKSSEKSELFSIVGTPYYLAPEIIDRSYNKSCDVWSLGIILYFILIGKHPFRGRTTKTVFHKASAGFTVIDLSEYSHLSGHVKDLLKKMLNPNERRRISSKLALEHPWFLDGLRKTDVPEIPLDSFKKIKADHQLWNLFLDILIQFLDLSQVNQICQEFEIMAKHGIEDINAKVLIGLLREKEFKQSAEVLESKVLEIGEGLNGEVNLLEFVKLLKEAKRLDIEEASWVKPDYLGTEALNSNKAEIFPSASSEQY